MSEVARKFLNHPKKTGGGADIWAEENRSARQELIGQVGQYTKAVHDLTVEVLSCLQVQTLPQVRVASVKERKVRTTNARLFLRM